MHGLAKNKNKTDLHICFIFFQCVFTVYHHLVLLQTVSHGGLAWIKLHGPAGPAQEGRVASLHHRQGHFGRGRNLGPGGGRILLTIHEIFFMWPKTNLGWGRGRGG